jgi:DNA-binding transcriptional LysR family regulator
MYTIDPDLLRSLVAFEELGSLSKAAERVGRSESAVSLQMKRLDDLFNQSLFIRSGRRLTLSDDGFAVLHYARRILAMNDELMSMMQRRSLSGRVRIASSQDFGEQILPRILRGMAQRYPDVKFEVQVEGGIQSLKELDRGAADVALTIGLPDHPSARRLQRAKLIWIASPEFKFPAHGPVPLIVFDQACRFKQRAIDALNAAGTSWEIVFKSPSLSGLWSATRANMGVTVRSSYWVPNGLIALNNQRMKLPDLGDTDVTIHYYEHALAPEIREIVRYIERSILLDSASTLSERDRFSSLEEPSRVSGKRPPAFDVGVVHHAAARRARAS